MISVHTIYHLNKILKKLGRETTKKKKTNAIQETIDPKMPLILQHILN
jgi:hypothetical protein